MPPDGLRSTALGRSLAQVAIAGSRGRGQSPGDFEGTTLVNANADQVAVTIPNRPEAGPAVLGDGDGAHDNGTNPPLCCRIASS